MKCKANKLNLNSIQGISGLCICPFNKISFPAIYSCYTNHDRKQSMHKTSSQHTEAAMELQPIKQLSQVLLG